MKRVSAIGLAAAFLLVAGFAAAQDTETAMANANYKVSKSSIYSWCGYPGPCTNPASALVLLEKQGPYEVIIGDQFSYQIQISNRASVDMIAVTLDDILPDGFSVDSIEPKPDAQSGNRVSWNLGTIPAKSAKIITITGRASMLGCLVSNALAKICYELPLPLSTRVIQCNIELTKTLPEVVDICDPIVMCLSVRNVGSAPATNVCITDELPEGLLTLDGQSKISISAGTIPVGGYKTFEVKLKATHTGEFTNTARATADRNCYSTATANIKVVAAELQLKAAGPADGYICTPQPYQITVTNVGNSPARDVVLLDSIDGQKVKIESISDGGKARGNKVAWALGTLEPNESRTVCLTLTSTVPGAIRSDFSVTGRCVDPKSATHCLTLSGVPGVLTSLKDSCDPVIIGNTVVYTVTASNTGSSESRNLRYTIKLDEGMEYVGGSGVTDITAVDERTLQFAPLPVLGIGETAAWNVSIKACSVGDKRFTADLMTDELTDVVSKSESTNFFQPTMAIVYAQ
ncbi:MAG: DUF11 domain-containing protein [Planctomycetota bacterium]|jgi:uncharacterized repeat protein (TIGR01451 family)|nr:DUF11 domain-containing protein [Planctomycetota bacterium]